MFSIHASKCFKMLLIIFTVTSFCASIEQRLRRTLVRSVMLLR